MWSSHEFKGKLGFLLIRLLALSPLLHLPLLHSLFLCILLSHLGEIPWRDKGDIDIDGPCRLRLLLLFFRSFFSSSSTQGSLRREEETLGGGPGGLHGRRLLCPHRTQTGLLPQVKPVEARRRAKGGREWRRERANYCRLRCSRRAIPQPPQQPIRRAWFRGMRYFKKKSILSGGLSRPAFCHCMCAGEKSRKLPRVNIAMVLKLLLM